MILCVCPNPSIDTLVTLNDLSPGDVHRMQREDRFPGGKGVHVALAAAELGCEVRLLAFWAGPTGTWIVEECERRGVRCAGPQVDGWSRTCMTFHSPGPYNETELLGTGPNVSEKNVQALQQELARLVPQASVVTLSGSWPPGAAHDSYARLLESAAEHHRPALLDCTGKLFELALAKRPDTIHLNRHEATELTGEEDPVAAARSLTKSCRLAVVTAGAEGAYFVGGGTVLHASCQIEAQYSAVGSGDCLLAGLAVARERGMYLRDAATLATACGAANCLRPEIGMLHRTDVERLVPQVKVQVI